MAIELVGYLLQPFERSSVQTSTEVPARCLEIRPATACRAANLLEAKLPVEHYSSCSLSHYMYDTSVEILIPRLLRLCHFRQGSSLYDRFTSQGTPLPYFRRPSRP